MAPILDIPDSYTVAEGDTLTSIAARLWSNLVSVINGIEDPNVIEAGEQLLIPAQPRPLWVTINEGDTLGGIVGTRLWATLFLANMDVISHPDQLEVGQTLSVPKLVAEVPPLD